MPIGPRGSAIVISVPTFSAASRITHRCGACRRRSARGCGRTRFRPTRVCAWPRQARDEALGRRAADALGLTQPALSKSLHRLEQAMQAKLARRTSKGVALSSVGAALFSRVRRLRPSLEDVTREVADLAHGRAGHLRIGCAPLFASHLLPAACTALLKDSPEVTLETTFLELEILLQARKGRRVLSLVEFEASPERAIRSRRCPGHLVMRKREAQRSAIKLCSIV